MADLEALLGHAVALESTADMVGAWKTPEPAEAALCVPVSSPTVPLGTLWFFCNRERPFSDEQTNMAEVVAGKIAADLERTALLQEQISRPNWKSKFRQPAARRNINCPSPRRRWPAGTSAAGPNKLVRLGGAFYDWRMIDDSSLMVMLGDACDGGIEAALATAALRAALRADDDGRLPDPDELLARANRILWESTAGGWWAGLWLGQLDLNKGRCDYVSAGRPMALLAKTRRLGLARQTLRTAGHRAHHPMGTQAIDPQPGRIAVRLQPRHRGNEQSIRPAAGRRHVRANLARRTHRAPERMIERVRDLLETQVQQAIQHDRSILMVKRLRAISSRPGHQPTCAASEPQSSRHLDPQAISNRLVFGTSAPPQRRFSPGSMTRGCQSPKTFASNCSAGMAELADAPG